MLELIKRRAKAVCSDAKLNIFLFEYLSFFMVNIIYPIDIKKSNIHNRTH